MKIEKSIRLILHEQTVSTKIENEKLKTEYLKLGHDEMLKKYPRKKALFESWKKDHITIRVLKSRQGLKPN